MVASRSVLSKNLFPDFSACRILDNQKSFLEYFKSTTENYSQERGDIGIRGFWAKQFDCIVDIKITYPESNSNRNSTVKKLIEKQEKEKKKQVSTTVPREEKAL